MIDCENCESGLPQDILMKIIKAQTKIVKIGHEISHVMNEVVKSAMELTASDGATIELSENGGMIYRAVVGTLEPFLGFSVPVGNSLSGLCVKDGQILYSEDTQNDERVDKKASKIVGAESMVVVPLKYGEHNVGVLKVISSKKKYYGNQTICILSMMAETMGAAMYHSGEYSIDELLLRATKDSMTGVDNRASFYEKLRLSFSKPAVIGLMIVDMDGLKTINDTYGHRAGDEAIKELALRLKKASRNGDIIARLGGDEFGIIISSDEPIETIEAILDRFRDALSGPYYFEGTPLNFGASIGFAIYPDDAIDMTDLIDLADKRMYESKKLRKSIR